MTRSTTRTRRAIAAAAVAALALGGGSALLAAGGTTTTAHATLKAKTEVPAPKGATAKASGSFNGTLKGRKLHWTLRFSNLTSTPAGAHIHTGAKGKTGPVVVVLCGTTCRSGMSGNATLSASFLKAMKAGKTYVNVHTTTNPSGEIRGQVKVTTKKN
jgi:hypothetical protein